FLSLKVQQPLGENLTHTAIKETPSYIKGENVDMDTKEVVKKEPTQDLSPQVTPKPDRGKGKVTDDVESQPKLVKASSEVRPDLNELVRVPFEINGKLYHLTKEEIQVHYELEERK
ncbi:hypothetical protein Tco_0275219, partial [Tanacetum coccineum]